jgi:ubiquinol-cytochrome c reductase cytochrome b subunit
MAWKKLVDYFDVRLGIRDILQQNLTHYLLPRNINVWYTLGSVLLALLVIQFATGILLLVYYDPSTEGAFDSVQRILNVIPFGWLIRTIHAVGANFFIIALLLHMLSVVFMASYKTPREFTWVTGFLILLVSLGLGLTGYLLPWSQLSFWATTVATEGAGAIPFIGPEMVHFLRGGTTVGQETLGRFFALHVMGLPLLVSLLIVLHLFCVRRVGISVPPFGPDYRPAITPPAFQHEKHPGGIPFFPNYAIKDVAVISFFLAAMMAVVFFAPATFFPPTAFEPADPFVTPPGIKPEWYFLWSYQVLKIFPHELIGMAVQVAFITFLLLLPFIDRGPERRPGRRPVFLACFFLGIAVFAILSIWGHYS